MPQNKTTRVFTSMLLATFICYALYVVLFGTLSTTMMNYYSIGTSAQGVFTMVGSIGGIAAAIICALYGERFFKPKTVAIGVLILGTATLLIGGAPPYIIVCICALSCGIGYTVIDVMGQATITEYFPDKAKTLLPLVQIFFGVGTMVGPILIASMINPAAARSFTVPFLLIGGLSLIVTLIYVLSFRKSIPDLLSIDLSSVAENARAHPAEVFKSSKSWVILLGCGLFSCFSTTVVAWYPAFFNTCRGFSVDTAALMLTLFYIGSLVMRLFGPLIFRKLSPQRVYITFSIASILCMLGAVNIAAAPIAMLLTVLGGAFCSLNVVSIVMISTALFPTRKASAASLAVFAYNIGGMAAPIIVGALAESAGLQLPINAMIAVFAVSVAVIGALCRKCKNELVNA
ncbi:MAG: MFS transporter [Christensenella sp.]